MTAFRLALLSAVLSPSVVQAVGFAHSDNFVVFSPNQSSRSEEKEYAQAVLRKAELFRQEVAVKWLGERLPDGAGESAIYIDFSASKDRGRTWAIDYPGREFHNVYLTTSPENAIGSTLHHEIVHTVMATAFPHPNRLPPWAEEGIASRYDDVNRKDTREQLRRYWVRGQRAPNLAQLLEMPDLRSLDESSYAASTSLVSYLLTLGDEQTILKFARDGQAFGWDSALRTHYQIDSLQQLQTEWEAWLANNPGLG